MVFVAGAIQHRAIDPWIRRMAELLPQFTVYAYDRRGRGESSDTAPYAVEREVEDLAAVMKEAGGSAYVIGISSGAVLGLEAAKRELPITKLALYEPPFIVDGSRPPTPADYVAQLTRLAASSKPGDAVGYFMTQATQMPEEQVDQIRKSDWWPGLERVAHTLAYDGMIMGDTMRGSPAPLQRFASIAVPTLVIDGGASPQFMHSGADVIAAVLQHAERGTLEGQTHEVDAEVLAPVLERFFTV